MTPEQLERHAVARARQIEFNDATLPRRSQSAGVGRRFAKILRKLRYGEGCQGCAKLARKMDAWGPVGCQEHEADILDELEGRAKDEGLFWSRMGARMALRLAIACTPIAKVAIEGELKAWRDGQT